MKDAQGEGEWYVSSRRKSSVVFTSQTKHPLTSGEENDNGVCHSTCERGAGGGGGGGSGGGAMASAEEENKAAAADEEDDDDDDDEGERFRFPPLLWPSAWSAVEGGRRTAESVSASSSASFSIAI